MHKNILNEQVYKDLIEEVRKHGLLKKTEFKYFFLQLYSFIFIGVSIYLLLNYDGNLWLVFLAWILFTFAIFRFGVLAHDLSHGMVYKNIYVNRFWAKIYWCLFLGLSEVRWHDKHNEHHNGPNHVGHDPDIQYAFIFSPLQDKSVNSLIKRNLSKYQHVGFFVLLPFVYYNNIIHAFRRMFEKFDLEICLEIFLILIHFSVLGYFLIETLSPSVAALFFLAHTFLGGAYMGAIFAPNHKGEEIIGDNEQYHWQYQITSTRNIRHTFLAHLALQGLDYQIEHHLFSNTSRYQYPKISKYVRKLCKEYNLEYSETSWPESFVEIYKTLKRESKRF